MTELNKRAWEAGVPPAPTGRTGRFLRALFYPDIHFGDQDDRALALALQVQRRWAPQLIVQLGDALDAEGLARFDKDPTRAQYHLKYELEMQRAFYRRIHEISRRAEKKQIKGNHENRITVFKWKNPQLMGLDEMEIANLMQLDKFGFEPKLHEQLKLANGAFLVRHGTHVRKHAGVSARAEWEGALLSGISGHTHRQAVYSRSSEGGEYSWTEAGHLQNNPSSWLTERADWHQGVVLGEFEVDGNAFEITPIRFRRSYRCIFNGKELSA